MNKKNRLSLAKLRQFLVTICLGPITFGTSTSWTSPVLPQLQNQNSTLAFTLSVSEGSWVGSMLAIGVLCSAIPSGYLADRFGLKRCCLIASTVPNVLFTLVIIFTKDVYSLCFARFISGISCGAVSVISPMYIADISHASMRGILGSFFEFLIYTGVILVSVCGAYVNYVTLTIILGFCSLIIGLAFLFFPESPTYLLKIGQKDKATVALKYYRNKDYDVSKDIDLLFNNFQHQLLLQNKVNIKKSLTTKCVVRGLVACIGLTLFQQLSGVDAIIFYSVQVFDETDTGLDSYMLAIILSIFQLISAVLIVFIVEKADRRVFLFISTFGCGTSSAMLGVYFNLKDNNISFLGFNYIPLVCMLIHCISFAFGLGPIPWLMNGDLFPHEVKGIANGITIFSNWVFLFIVTKTFPISMEDIGRCFPFYFYSICMVLCLVFINFCVPETRGKTLDQIQIELSS